MRIDSNQPLANQVVTDRSNGNSSKTGTTAEASHDGASFSADPAGVGSLEAKALATPEIRQDKVEALRQAISNGTYQVDPGKIADAMLNEASL